RTPLPTGAALHINGSAPDTNGSLDQLLTSLLSHGGSGVSAGVFGADGLFETPSGTPAPTECDDFTSLIQSTFPSDGFDSNARLPFDSNGVPMNTSVDAGSGDTARGSVRLITSPRRLVSRPPPPTPSPLGPDSERLGGDAGRLKARVPEHDRWNRRLREARPTEESAGDAPPN
ncbi:hypothetical protein EV715DRAFT_297894, partial [Schizophyllum commune]